MGLDFSARPLLNIDSILGIVTLFLVGYCWVSRIVITIPCDIVSHTRLIGDKTCLPIQANLMSNVDRPQTAGEFHR